MGNARVLLVRTSEPPCFSVMAMPMVTPCFCSTGTLRGSYTREVILGSHTLDSSGCRRSEGTAAKVMVMGQPWPASTWVCI